MYLQIITCIVKIIWQIFRKKLFLTGLYYSVDVVYAIQQKWDLERNLMDFGNVNVAKFGVQERQVEYVVLLRPKNLFS